MFRLLEKPVDSGGSGLGLAPSSDYKKKAESKYGATSPSHGSSFAPPHMDMTHGEIDMSHESDETQRLRPSLNNDDIKIEDAILNCLKACLPSRQCCSDICFSLQTSGSDCCGRVRYCLDAFFCKLPRAIGNCCTCPSNCSCDSDSSDCCKLLCNLLTCGR